MNTTASGGKSNLKETSKIGDNSQLGVLCSDSIKRSESGKSDSSLKTSSNVGKVGSGLWLVESAGKINFGD